MIVFYLLSENDKDMTERREKSSPYSLLLQKYQTLRHLNPVYIFKTFKFNNDAKFYAKLSEWGTHKIQSNLTSNQKASECRQEEHKCPFYSLQNIQGAGADASL